MKFKIRNAELKDIDQVAKLNAEDWKKFYKGIIDDEYLNSITAKEKAERMKKIFDKDKFIVAVHDDEILGFCRYCDYTREDTKNKNYDCELCAIYVRADLVKKIGIGRALFEYVLNYFKSKGKKKMVVYCLAKNYPARKFYEKMGGKVLKYIDIDIGGKSYEEVAYVYDI